MTLVARLERAIERAGVAVSLGVYDERVIERLSERLGGYQGAESAPPRRRWWRGREESRTGRVAPLLLAGPVGTGKTTLMMLLDLALEQASARPLLERSIEAHPSAIDSEGERIMIELRPLSLMGAHRNVPTGVVRLGELQRFHRLFTYDRDRSRTDPEAERHFAALFRDRIVYIDEFVPDVVTSFPMRVINQLADHGVQVVLSSNRRETPFVEGVELIPVVGEDMRGGRLAAICLPAGPDERFARLVGASEVEFGQIARGLVARVAEVEGERWMAIDFDRLAPVPAGWLAFKELLQQTDRLLLDRVPLFDLERGAGVDAARRVVILIDALYDERRPTLLRLTNEQPLPESIDGDHFRARYPAELLIDLERALSRLRELSPLWER